MTHLLEQAIHARMAHQLATESLKSAVELSRQTQQSNSAVNLSSQTQQSKSAVKLSGHQIGWTTYIYWGRTAWQKANDQPADHKLSRVQGPS